MERNLPPGLGTDSRDSVLESLASEMIAASRIDNTVAEVIAEIDAIHARAIWLGQVLADFVPSRKREALQAKTNLLGRALQGLGEPELALIAAHGFKGDGDQIDDAVLALRFQNVTDDYALVAELMKAARRLVVRSRSVTARIKEMVDPKAFVASKPKMSVRRELLLRLSGAWQDLTGKPFTGYGPSERFARAFFDSVGVNLEVSETTIQNDWRALR